MIKISFNAPAGPVALCPSEPNNNWPGVENVALLVKLPLPERSFTNWMLPLLSLKVVEALIIALPVTLKPVWVLITLATASNTTLPLPLAVASKLILPAPPVAPMSLKKLIWPLLVFKVRVRTALVESIVLLKEMFVPEAPVIERF